MGVLKRPERCLIKKKQSAGLGTGSELGSRIEGGGDNATGAAPWEGKEYGSAAEGAKPISYSTGGGFSWKSIQLLAKLVGGNRTLLETEVTERQGEKKKSSFLQNPGTGVKAEGSGTVRKGFAWPTGRATGWPTKSDSAGLREQSS